MFKAVLFALFATLALGDNWLGCKTYEDSYKDLDHMISEDVEMIPSMVRLAFHDCVGHSCDGCINFDDDHNYGLELTIEKVDKLWAPYHKLISRADWWQLASHVALVRAGLNQKCHHDGHHDAHHDKLCAFPDLKFWWGRKDCKTSPHSHHEDKTGSGHGDYSEVFGVLHHNFGLDHKETVALMGVHSIGGGHKAASGFHFNWQEEYLTFNNYYFKNLISLPYTQYDVTRIHTEGAQAEHPEKRDEFIWFPYDKHQSPLVMMNTDISLWKDVHGEKKPSHDHHHDEWTGELTCKNKHHQVVHIKDGAYNQIQECEDAPTAHIVYEYAHNLEHFFHDFSGAWWKMVTHGYYHEHSLKEVGFPHEHCGYCIPKDAFCVDGFEKAGQCCPGTHCVHNHCV